MIRTPKTIRVLAFLALIVSLVGCTGPTAVVEPTPDIPLIRTEAVQTVVSKLTIEAALNPTATIAPTDTPAPVVTATSAPTATQPPAATATSMPTIRPATSGGGGVVYPTATRRSGPDQANLLSQEPKDGTVVSAGSEFDGSWVFKNIGTSTWTTGYEYRFAGGTNLAKKDIYTVPGSVKPNDSITLYTDMVAPSEGGRYVSYWELVNENGDIFYEFYMIIDVK